METVVSHGAGCLKRIALLPDITKKRISFIRTMRAVRVSTTTAERNLASDIESGNIVCESEYRNAWVKYRMATWIFILPLFCLVSSAMHYRR